MCVGYDRVIPNFGPKSHRSHQKGFLGAILSFKNYLLILKNSINFMNCFIFVETNIGFIMFEETFVMIFNRT